MSSASYSDINDSGTVSVSNRYNTSYTYADLRGNISNLQRNGLYLNGSCYTQALLDNMTYSYTVGTNKISSISDAASATQGGFRAASGAFTYDANGNIKTYPSKSITNINYNHLNLPILIDFSGGKVIELTYAADGSKLKKVVKNTGGVNALTQDYINGGEYKNGVIEAFYHSEGRVYNNSGWKREYTIKDHLGNTRITYSDINNDGVVATPSEILQENHYDAFGYGLDGAYMNHTNSDNLYQYNGKEIFSDHGLNWYAYGKRVYDPAIARFPSVDPIIDKFPFYTPYNYAANEPIKNIDLHGLQAVSSNTFKSVLNDIKKDGIATAIKNYFNIGNLITGSPDQQAQTITRVNKAADVAKKVEANGLKVADNGLQKVGEGAGVIQKVALTTTAVSGGASSAVTGPIATIAGGIETASILGRASIEYYQNNNLDNTQSELITQGISAITGRVLDNGVDLLKIGGKEPKKTNDALKAVSNGVNETFKDVLNKDKKSQ